MKDKLDAFREPFLRKITEQALFSFLMMINNEDDDAYSGLNSFFMAYG